MNWLRNLIDWWRTPPYFIPDTERTVQIPDEIDVLARSSEWKPEDE